MPLQRQRLARTKTVFSLKRSHLTYLQKRLQNFTCKGRQKDSNGNRNYRERNRPGDLPGNYYGIVGDGGELYERRYSLRAAARETQKEEIELDAPSTQNV